MAKHWLVPGPMSCPEVVAISYIRLAKVLALFSVEGDAQVEQKNHTSGFLTIYMLRYLLTKLLQSVHE